MIISSFRAFMRAMPYGRERLKSNRMTAHDLIALAQESNHRLKERNEVMLEYLKHVAQLMAKTEIELSRLQKLSGEQSKHQMSLDYEMRLLWKFINEQ